MGDRTPGAVPGNCRGPSQSAYSGGRCVPQRTRAARKPARRQARRPQNKPTAVRATSMCSGRKNGRIRPRRWNGWHGRSLDADTTPTCSGPPCRKNSPPSSVPPMRRSSCSLPLSRMSAARTATSRCCLTFGSGGPTVSESFAPFGQHVLIEFPYARH